MWGDLLAGLLHGASTEVQTRRQQTREDQERALEPKREIGKLILSGMLEGKTHPDMAMPLVNDYVRSFEPRTQSVGGFRGFLGEQQMPETPGLDALMGGQTPWSGPGGVFVDPKEEFDRQTDWLVGRAEVNGRMTLKAELDQLPTMIATLTRLGVSPDTARNIALSKMFTDDVLGMRGTPITFWDPVSKTAFKGQRSPIQGNAIVNVATGDVVPGARAVEIDERANWQNGTVDYIDRFSGETLHQAKGVVPPPYASPYFYGGGAFTTDPRSGAMGFTPIPGAPAQAPPINPEHENLKFVWTTVNHAADQALEYRKQVNWQYLTPEEKAAAAKEVQDEAAKNAGYPSYEALRTTVFGQPVRQPVPGRTPLSMPPPMSPVRSGPQQGERRRGPNPTTGLVEERIWNGTAWVLPPG